MNIHEQIGLLKKILSGEITSIPVELLQNIMVTLLTVKNNLSSSKNSEIIVSMSTKDYRNWEEYKLFQEFKAKKETEQDNNNKF